MPTISEVLQRQIGAIQGLDSANAKAQAALATSTTTNQQLYNAKNDVRLASQEGSNARLSSELYRRQNPSEFDGQIITNNDLIQQRREQSFDTINQIDERLGPDYTPVLDQPGVGGNGAVTGQDENIAPDFTPVRGETQGATSSGAIVDNEALARADGASTQTPYPSHLTTAEGETVTTGNADEISTYNPVLYEPTPGLEEITVVGGGLNPDDASVNGAVIA